MNGKIGPVMRFVRDSRSRGLGETNLSTAAHELRVKGKFGDITHFSAGPHKSGARTMGSMTRERRPSLSVRGRTNHYGCALGDEMEPRGAAPF
jgi:hypothetical protein